MPLDRCIFKIIPVFPKLNLPSLCTPGPVFMHQQSNIFPWNTRCILLICQPLCCELIVFSLCFVNRNRLRDQCLVYKGNGYSGEGGGLFNRSMQCWFLIPHFWAAFLMLNPLSRKSLTALAKVVDRLLLCTLQLLRKGLYSQTSIIRTRWD